jgi:hypothetical protein
MQSNGAEVPGFPTLRADAPVDTEPITGLHPGVVVDTDLSIDLPDDMCALIYRKRYMAIHMKATQYNDVHPQTVHHFKSQSRCFKYIVHVTHLSIFFSL